MSRVIMYTASLRSRLLEDSTRAVGYLELRVMRYVPAIGGKSWARSRCVGGSMSLFEPEMF